MVNSRIGKQQDRGPVDTVNKACPDWPFISEDNKCKSSGGNYLFPTHTDDTRMNGLKCQASWLLRFQPFDPSKSRSPILGSKIHDSLHAWLWGDVTKCDHDSFAIMNGLLQEKALSLLKLWFYNFFFHLIPIRRRWRSRKGYNNL